METVNKTFGVKKVYYKGSSDYFQPVVNGTPCISLHYKTFKKGLQSAEDMSKKLYKDFTNFQNIQIHFTFQNLGLITYQIERDYVEWIN